MFTHGPVENLADELAETLPGELSKLYFLCSGSEAVEAALKLARQYWIERGRPTKHRIITLGPGYHGSTLLALSASAREAYKAMFRPWLVDVHRIPASYPYRCECGGQNASCPICSGNVLEEAITQLGAENVAAFIAEPVGGSSTGGSTPRPEYFRRVREICDRHDVLFIADEVLVGVGRTGTWWAIEPYGVAPDILTLGKGISGGYAALSAIAAPEKIVTAIVNGSGNFMHAQTFSHHPVACAAGVATMRHLKQHKLVERCAQMGRVLQERLRFLTDLPHVGDVRGRGLLAGIEFVADKASRAWEWCSAGLVCDEFDAGEETTPTDITHVRQVGEEPEPLLQHAPHLGAALHELVLLEVPHRRHPGRAGNRMMRKCLRVHEVAGTIDDRSHDFLRSRDGRQRCVAAGDSFSQRQDVGRDAVGLDRPPGAGPAHTDQRLVGLARGCGQGEQRAAVVAGAERDDAVLVGAAALDPVLPGQLQRRFDGLRSTTEEVDLGEIAWQGGGDFIRQVLDGSIGEHGAREIAVLPALLGDRVGDFGVGMAEVGDVGAADGVEVALAALVDEPTALAPHDLWVLVA